VLPPREAWLYDEGIRVLEAPYNDSHGWNLTGPPVEVFGRIPHLPRPPPLHPSAPRRRRLALAGSRPPTPALRPAWDFVGADIDQGLLAYMLFARHRLGAYVRRKAELLSDPRVRRSELHLLRHHMGMRGKPWLLALAKVDHKLGVCHPSQLRLYVYLRQLPLGQAVTRPNVSVPSPCAVAFATRQREMETAGVLRCPNLTELSRVEASALFGGLLFRPF